MLSGRLAFNCEFLPAGSGRPALNETGLTVMAGIVQAVGSSVRTSSTLASRSKSGRAITVGKLGFE
jgi:hypothetical protein